MAELLGAVTGAAGVRITRRSREGLYVVAGAGCVQAGQWLPFGGSGLGCESVIRSRDRVLLVNPAADLLWHELNPEWANSPDLEAGYPVYLGYPVRMPRGGMYGSICLLNTAGQEFSGEHDLLLRQFRDSMEEQLERLAQEATLQAHCSVMTEGVMLLDSRDAVRDVNDAFLAAWGLNRKTVATEDLGEVVKSMARLAADSERARRALMELLEGRDSDNMVMQLASGDAIQCRAKRLDDGHGNSWGTALYCGMQASGTSPEAFLCDAHTCTLGTVCSMDNFFEIGRHELERSKRYGKPLSLLILELSGVSGKIYGEEAASALVSNAVGRVRAYARNLDLIGTLGGRRLGVILPETDHAGAEMLASRISEVVQGEPYDVDGESVYLRAEWGIAALSKEIGTLESLLAIAQSALSNAEARSHASETG